MKRCIIFCGGEFDRLHDSLAPDDLVIAADKGLAYTQQLGIRPHVILGDFDSLGYIPAGAEVFPVEKDDTDAMLAVRRGLDAGCSEFILYGALDGDRVDHTVANFQLLVYLADRSANGTLAGIRQCATVIKNGSIAFPGEYTGNLSVFCIGADARGVTIRGAKYGAENICLTGSFPLGVSNSFTGSSVEISVEDGRLLVIYDRQRTVNAEI